MSVRLGWATAADVVELAELTTQGAHDPLSEAQLQSEIERAHAHLLVARTEANQLVGYVLYWHVADEMEIHDVVVHPAHRRKGIARTLFQEIFSMAKTAHCSHIYLDVRETNQTAIALYRGLGFVSVGTRANYYRKNNENAVLMRLDLEGPSTGA